MTAFNIANFAGQVTIQDTGNNILITVAGGTIELVGVSGTAPNTVNVADFII